MHDAITFLTIFVPNYIIFVFLSTLLLNYVQKKWKDHFFCHFFTPAMFTNIKSNRCNARRIFEKIQKIVQNWIYFENFLSFFSITSTLTKLVKHYWLFTNLFFFKQQIQPIFAKCNARRVFTN